MREIYLKFSEKGKYDVKIETIEEMSSSIFLDSYIQAYKELYTISFESKNNDEIDRNNIIAFLGERGSGKTSCMRSFLGSLRCLNEHNFILGDEKLKKNLEKFSEINFEILNIVEPSFFSEKINVIELVVSNMFKNFSIEIEKNNKDYEMKRTLLKNFQEIFKNMKYMKCSEAYQNSEIEELITLSTSVNLKNHLNELIEQYLKLFSKDKLIISIDDIDLNTKFAYSMAEDVRKYLSIPNVIIILALKLEQLKTIITKEYIEEYKYLLEDKAVVYDDYNRYVMEDIENRVEKYLLKLIPYERRIYLKNLDSFDDNVKIFINGKPLNIQNEKIQDIILNFIFKETDMLFMKPEYKISKIIPTNLRELVGFTAILGKMDTSYNSRKMRNGNYKILKNYLYTYIFENKLKPEELNVIKNLLTISYDKKNNYIIRELMKKSKGSSNQEDLPQGTSIVDVIKSIKIIEDDISFFPFCLKVVYSNLLYETIESLENKNFYYLLGKGDFFDTGKFTLFKLSESIRRIILKKDSLKILELFFLENVQGSSEEEKYVSFSLIAPFQNIISNLENTYLFYEYNIIFTNIEIYEQFYLFLKNIKYDTKNINISNLQNIIEDFYTFFIEKFIETFPNPLKNKLKNKLKEFIIQIKNITLGDLLILKRYIKLENENKNS